MTSSYRARLGQRLTPTEKTLLVLLANGRRPRDIAAEQHVTIGTIYVHMQNINRRLGTHNQTQAVAAALLLGEIQARDVVLNVERRAA